MYRLPLNTLINKPLYKKAVFEKSKLKAVERDRFNADISHMALVAWLSTETVSAMTKGKEIEGFYVLQIKLKHQEYDAKNILLLQKLIPQKLIFALQFEEQTQFCIFHTRLQQSAWMPTDEATITLQGLSVDDVWTNIIAIIGGLDAQAEETIEEQIIHREQRKKMLRQIESLEKRACAEKQTHKRYELHQQIVKLKEELSL